jgi:hypothetical protein
MSIGADLALVGKNHINLDVASITMSAIKFAGQNQDGFPGRTKFFADGSD